MSNTATRALLSLAAIGLLWLAALHIPRPAGGQSAVSLSRPGQEDLTFWVNHNGLEQIDVEGEVGFGDLARILMRRRDNRETFRALRDRFVFKSRDARDVRTPDLFRVRVTESGPAWSHRPERFVVAAGRILNLPLVVENAAARPVMVDAWFNWAAQQSLFSPVEIVPDSGKAFFLKAAGRRSGVATGRLTVRVDGREISAEVTLDVRPLARLRVRLLDADGKPAAARVYLTASDGLAYAPAGAISRITAMSAEYYFHAQDSFELELPAGPAVIEATRGLEYELTTVHADLEPAEPADVTVELKRWARMALRGWYSSDSHIHANYTAEHHQVITPEDVRLQTLAEDLNNANLMVANSSGGFIHDQQHFEGGPHALSRPNYVIYWNEEMRNAGMYGHMSFFNLKSLVHPIYTGFRDTPQWEDYPPNFAQAKAAQEQGGAVAYVHPGYGPAFEQASARELPVDLALGVVDAMDVVSNNDEVACMLLWYRLLNCGFRLAISAGSDSFTNVADHYTPGAHRVYVRTASPLDYQEWVRDYKLGRSFATNGPLIFFTVDGKLPGDELKFPAGSSQKVRVRATMRTQVPVDQVEVIVNGNAEVSLTAAGKNVVEIDEEIPLTGSSWIAIRALGQWHRLVLNDHRVFAHTSPVYISFGDELVAVRDHLRFYIDWIEKLIARVNERGRFATPERKQEVIALLERALAIYREREAAISN